MLPDLEESLLALAVDTSAERERAWRRIVVVGNALSEYPPRSRDRREATALIAQILQMRAASQRAAVRIWRVLTENPNGIHLPLNLHPSTARVLAEHGATCAQLLEADERGMTLAEARAWAQGQAKVAEEKPVTLWRHLTKAIPADLRKATSELTTVDTMAFLTACRKAFSDWNAAHKEEAESTR